MAKIAYKGKNSNLIAYKGDHEPIKVAVGGSVVENLSFKEKLVSGTSSVSYSSEYKKNLLEMQIHGRTRQTLLPLEYQQVEYIQSDGYCYIDTGVVPTDDTSVDLTFRSDAISGAHYIFGTRYSNANATVTFSMGASASNDYWAVYISGTPYLSTFKRVSSQKINVVIGKFDNGRNITFKNLETGVESQVSTEAVYTVTNLSAWLFGYNGMGQSISPKAQKIKIYSCKIYEKDILVRNFIPCYRNSDGVIGMYDTTNGVFYTRGGTGTFLKGADYTLTLSPEAPQQIFSTGDDGIRLSLDGKEVNIPISLRYKDKLVIDFTSRQVYVNRHTALFTVRGEDVIAFAPPENGITQAIIELPVQSLIVDGSYTDIAYCTHATHEPSGKKILNTFYLYNLGKHFHIIFSDSITTISECREYIEELYASGTPIQLAYAVGEPYAENYSESDFAKSLLDLNDYTQNQTNIIEIESELEPSGLNVTYAKWEV